MIDEIKKSINSIFEERVSSPFYGTLITSWLIWNWKIVYLTFFVDQDKLKGTKIDFIMNNYNDIWDLIYFPLISTVILLTVIPFLTNGAYWLDLKFTTWRINQKNDIEGKKLLTLEQSIKLRSDLRELEENFEKLLERKNGEIQLLQNQLNELNNSKTKQDIIDFNGEETASGDYKALIEKNLIEDFVKCYKVFYNGASPFPEDIAEEKREFFIVNGYFRSSGSKYFVITEKARNIYAEIFNRNYVVN
ncbi:hypothetical protein [Flavobacterium sp. DG2-3]|uniref:hypothetical protein n=1 Tax=Flavobacterium sp. DG2-3 TaxID=3068317 RepID=UPI00273E4D83|nr:hypothetical protein [Flavobacterium sp. DG2-3]MDP5198565.1 hypothetical protein [Flavobacterium sp. DG2-3]